MAIWAGNRYTRMYGATLSPSFTVTAHTGAMGTKKNSIDSIVKSAESGADIVEFDIMYREDGTPVLAHYEKEIKNAPTLREAFAAAAAYPCLGFNVDLKEFTYVDRVEELILEFNLQDKAFFTGIHLKDVAEVKEKAPNIRFYLNTDFTNKLKNDTAAMDKEIASALEIGAIGLNLGYKYLTKELVTRAHAANLLVSVYTPSTKWAFSGIMHLGADNITTKRPDKLFSVIKGN
jgi:glycerophosphoryl diester phosphodiesterase